MTEVKVCVSESPDVFSLAIDGLFFVEHEANYLTVEQNGLLFWNGNLSKICTAKY